VYNVLAASQNIPANLKQLTHAHWSLANSQGHEITKKAALIYGTSMSNAVGVASCSHHKHICAEHAVISPYN
jgi:hypothetical protein